MLQIFGDEIVLEGIVIARFEKAAWPTLRDRAASIMDGALPDMVAEDEVVLRCSDEFRRGVTDGEQEGVATAKPLCDAVRWVLDCETVILKKAERAMLERILKRYDAYAENVKAR